MLEEQQGGQCDGNRVSKGQVDRRRDREADWVEWGVRG